MALRDLLFEGEQVANANPANVAKDTRADTDTLAGLATLALAKTKHSKTNNAVSIPKTTVDPVKPCPHCGSSQWWQLPDQAWHCRACEPYVPLRATTLTLPCHKEQVPPVGIHNGLERMPDVACARLAPMIFTDEVTKTTEAFHELKDLYPVDDEFQAAFREKEERTNSKAAYLLRRLERVLRGEKRGANTKELDPGMHLTVEHIVPKNPTPEWRRQFKDDDEVDSAIYRLGNLFLVARKKIWDVVYSKIKRRSLPTAN